MNNGHIHTFRSKDGHLLKLRPLQPEDAQFLVDLFEHMGSESRFLRFNLALTDPDPELVWSEARRLSRIDPERDGAWLAFAELPDEGDVPVGGARYMRLDENSAEASLVVRDDMQNKGIGSEMLDYLVQHARDAGIEKLVATIQRNNRPIIQLLLRSKLYLEWDSKGGYSTVTAFLTEPEVTE